MKKLPICVIISRLLRLCDHFHGRCVVISTPERRRCNMTDESCIHCGTQVDFSSGSNCEPGPIHFACKEAFHNGRVPEPETPHDPEAPDSSSTDAQTDAKDYPLSARILGGFLRFFGMLLIVGAAIFWLIGAGIGHPLPSLPSWVRREVRRSPDYGQLRSSCSWTLSACVLTRS